MNEINYWTPRVSSIRLSGKQFWGSHSLYGALIGIFLSDVEASAASLEYDRKIEIEIEIVTEQVEAVQVLKATILLIGRKPIIRYIAYDQNSEAHAATSAETLGDATARLAEEYGGKPIFR